MNVESTIEIERPIEEVFEVATCMRRCVVWIGPMSNSQMDSDEPIHVGSTFSGEMHLGGQTIHASGVITELDPPHRSTFKLISPSGLTRRLSFVATEHGTRFRMAAEVEGGPMMESFEDPSLLKAAMESNFQQALEQLKMLMENDVDLWTLIPA